jgi:hypothetical protein
MLTVLRGLLLGTLSALLIAASLPASAQDRDYDQGVFYEELAPYGDWFEHPRWGAVWRPNVPGDWRPYSRGHWAYTQEHGWYWVTEEPFGWAVFHYGRWVLDEDDGWIWIPGNEWGPAWVAWRYSDEFVGWAPLPPDTRWGANGALIYDERLYDEPRYASAAWCFVRPSYLTAPGLYRLLAPPPQNFFILRRTRHVYGYRRHGGGIFNSGYDVRRYERHIGRPVPLMRLRGVDNPREHGLGRGRGGADIPVFRPRIIDRPDGPRVRPPFVVSPDRRPPGQPGPVPGFSRRTPELPSGGGAPPGPRGPLAPGLISPPSAGIPPGEGPPRPRFKQPQKGPESLPTPQRRVAPPAPLPGGGAPPVAGVPPPQQPRVFKQTPPPPKPPAPPPPAARAPPPPPPPAARMTPPPPRPPALPPPAARAAGPPPVAKGPPPARKKEEKKGPGETK